MTKRTLYTRDEVLQGILDSSEQDLSDSEHTDGLEDDDGPMAEGSDDEFTDLDEEEQEYPTQPDIPFEYVKIYNQHKVVSKI